MLPLHKDSASSRFRYLIFQVGLLLLVPVRCWPEQTDAGRNAVDVPEPTTISLVCLALVVILAQSRRLFPDRFVRYGGGRAARPRSFIRAVRAWCARQIAPARETAIQDPSSGKRSFRAGFTRLL